MDSRRSSAVTYSSSQNNLQLCESNVSLSSPTIIVDDSSTASINSRISAVRSSEFEYFISRRCPTPISTPTTPNNNDVNLNNSSHIEDFEEMEGSANDRIYKYLEKYQDARRHSLTTTKSTSLASLSNLSTPNRSRCRRASSCEIGANGDSYTISRRNIDQMYLSGRQYEGEEIVEESINENQDEEADENDEENDRIRAQLDESIQENSILQEKLQEKEETIEKVMKDLKDALTFLEVTKSRRNSLAPSAAGTPSRLQIGYNHRQSLYQSQSQNQMGNSSTYMSSITATSEGNDDEENVIQLMHTTSIERLKIRFTETFSSIQIDREELISRIGSSSRIAQQVLVGNTAGWCTALLLKKFGKIALTACAGGMLTLYVANRRDYINVNWMRITERILQLENNEGVEAGNGGSDLPTPSSSSENLDGNQLIVNSEESEDQENSGSGRVEQWFHGRLDQVKGFSRDNSYAVVGFMAVLMYKILS